MLAPLRHLPLLPLLALSAAARAITVKNSCSATIWPAYAGRHGSVTDPSGQPAPAGWELERGGQTALHVADDWSAGRIWARTGGCHGNVANCRIGACAGKGVECDGTESGVTGATLAEFTLNNVGKPDSYDVSMVDGFSVPMSITPSGGQGGGCEVAACGTDVDLLTKCDPRLVWPKGSNEIYGCASACLAGLEFAGLTSGTFDPSNSPSCCTGKWLAHADCPKDVIPFYNTYKPMCKNAYVYADDDNYDAAVLGCVAADYIVEFCPGGVGSGLDDPPTQAVIQDPGGELVGGTVDGYGLSVGTAQATGGLVAVQDDTATTVAPITSSSTEADPTAAAQIQEGATGDGAGVTGGGGAVFSWTTVLGGATKTITATMQKRAAEQTGSTPKRSRRKVR